MDREMLIGLRTEIFEDALTTHGKKIASLGPTESIKINQMSVRDRITRVEATIVDSKE